MTERDDHFYSALVNAFVATRMEADKSLLALSSGGIGLTITLLATFGAANTFAAVCYGVMLVEFLTTVVVTLVVFRLNSAYIRATIREVNEGHDPERSDDVQRERRRLRFWGWAATASFALGILASSVLGVALTFS